MFRELAITDAELLAELHAASFDKSWNVGEFEALFASGAVGWGLYSHPIRDAHRPLPKGVVKEENLSLWERSKDAKQLSGEGALATFILLRPVVDEAEILTIATHPDFRRQGYAQKLLRQAEAELAGQGVSRLFLEVRVDNAAAQKLYLGIGFEPIATRKGYYTLPNGKKMDAAVMQKILNTMPYSSS